MSNLNRKQFQAFPFHLVDPSPWPILISVALLTMAVGAVLSFHGFNNGGLLLSLGFVLTVSGMILWFRDVIIEGTKIKQLKLNIKLNYLRLKRYLNFLTHTTRLNYKISTINLDSFGSSPLIKELNDKSSYSLEEKGKLYSMPELGHYLAGLLEGDGNINIPALGTTTLNRVLNPRIVFTGSKTNLSLYKFIQSKLDGRGRFLTKDEKTIRYIVGDIEGIKLLINLMHGKLRTPKNITFNKLIEFMNTKYNLKLEESKLDSSDISNNSWFTGFTDSDGYFGVKIREARPKSDKRIRSASFSINLRFNISQRAFDRPTSSSMKPIMLKLSKFLDGNLLVVKKNANLKLKLEPIDILIVEVSALNKLENLIHYFNTYPLLGIKRLDFYDWESVYIMIKNKEHLTDSGRLKIKSIKSNMNSKRKF